MHLQESGEMYLETILILSKQTGMVRSIDVSNYMGYSKPSVSRAIGLLKDAGYVLVETTGELVLTESGREIAEKIYERHMVLSRILMEIGVSEKAAVEDACRIEHVISDETFDIIRKHVENAEGKRK